MRPTDLKWKYEKVKKQFQSTEQEWNSYISRSYIAM